MTVPKYRNDGAKFQECSFGGGAKFQEPRCQVSGRALPSFRNDGAKLQGGRCPVSGMTVLTFKNDGAKFQE